MLEYLFYYSEASVTVTVTVAECVPSVAVITEVPASTPVTFTCLLSIFVTVAFATVPLVNVIVGLAWNGVVVIESMISPSSSTVGFVSLNLSSEAGTDGVLVASTIPVTE